MMAAWEAKPLGQIVSLQRGFDLPTQSRSEGKIAVIGSNGIVGFHNSMPSEVPIPGLMLGRSGSVGEITYWDKKYWPLNTVLYVKDFHGNDPYFLSFWLQLFPFKQYAQGVSVPTLNRNSINDVLFPIPKLEDQQKIALALSVVATSIKFNAAAIAKSQELKRTAMRDLFARGLRGEAQKETEFGLVPESWVVSMLSEVSSIERGRFLHRPRNEPRFYGGPTPFVQTGDVVRSAGRIRDFTQSLNSDGVRISRVFPAGTILITIAANIGYTGILQFASACPDSLVAITPNPNVDTSFLEYFLQTQQPEMDRRAPKGTQKNINIQFLNPWPVPVPPLDEQGEIVAILDAIDRKIELHQKKRATLEELFKALLHRLMTGEIRVTDLDLSALSQTSMTGAAA